MEGDIHIIDYVQNNRNYKIDIRMPFNRLYIFQVRVNLPILNINFKR